jgi:hypothetical protein
VQAVSAVKRAHAAVWVVLACALGLGPASACNGDDDGGDEGRGDAGRTCLDPLPLDCSPTFQPTYQAFYDNLLSRTCGAASTGSSCHSEEGAMAGLVLQDEDDAYDYLLGNVDGHRRVVPFDPECSVLIQRLESDDPDFVMPVGAKLSEGQRCAVRKWIAAGAER